MEKVFIAGHGQLQSGQEIKIPPGMKVFVYADAGESLLGPNAYAAIDSNGSLGARDEFGRGTGRATMPNYKVTRFTDTLITRTLAAKGATGSTLYIAGLDEVSGPGLGTLDWLKHDFAMLRFLLSEVAKKHPGPIDLHLMICRVNNFDAKPLNEVEYSSTVAFGSEERKDYDKSWRRPGGVTEFPDDDNRHFPSLRKEVNNFKRKAKVDPQAVVSQVKRARTVKAAQLMSAGMGPACEDLWKSLTPHGIAAFLRSGMKYFPQVLSGVGESPSSFFDATTSEQWRNAFYAYLNGIAEQVTPRTIAAVDLYYLISPIVSRGSGTDEELREIVEFLDASHVLPINSGELQFFLYKEKYLKEKNADGLADINCMIPDDFTAELAKVPDEIIQCLVGILGNLYVDGAIQVHWEGFPPFLARVVAKYQAIQNMPPQAM
ncbi:putative adhesin [Streptomyces sp. IBSNAI002]|uniref:putative adhesin n=1 Tax=Streptomyces sp. IBSNAI002 TaxID=3457500 RepID=UPI003FD5395F